MSVFNSRRRCSNNQQAMAHARRVVITGMGVVTSLGDSLDRFWEALCAGQSGVGELTLFDTTEFRVHFGGQVRDWDPAARFGVKEARHLDRFAQFAMAAAISAVDDSGIDFSTIPAENCGVFIGSGIGGLSEFESQHTIMMQKGPSRISPFVIPKLMVNAASGQVSIRWGLTGAVLGGGDGVRLGGQRDRRRLPAHPVRSMPT